MRVLSPAAALRHGTRVVKTVPRPSTPWADLTTDPHTRTVLRSLAALGFEAKAFIDNRCWLTTETRTGQPIELVLTVDRNDPTVILTVARGEAVWPASVAARWLEGLAS